MTTRTTILFTGLLVCVVGVRGTNAQTRQEPTAGEALRQILSEDGPVSGRALDDLLALFQSQLTTFPIGSSAGGFTWGFDSNLGIQVRRSRSFGPMFADRPHTNGRRKLTMNFAFQRTEWKSIAGESFDDGLMTWFITDPDDGFTGHPEGSFHVTRLQMTTERTIFGASYGLTDKIDVGVLVPFGRTTVSGVTDISITDLHSNRPVIRPEHYEAAGASSGLGDIILRSKVAAFTRPSFLMSGGVDVRMPTGEEDKLLGSGGAQAKLLLLGAVTKGNTAPHFNIGYTFVPGLTTSQFRRGSPRPDEINYATGIDVALSTQVTIAGDLVGRTLMNGTRVFRETVGGFNSSFDTDKRNVHLLLGTVGGKVLIGNMWLVTASIAFPLNNNGVKPGVTPVVGFERAF